MKISSFIAGLILIIVGLVIFLGNIGYDSWTFTRQLYKFWPVLLILIGISYLWGGVIPRLLGIILIIALSGCVVALTLLNPADNLEFFRDERVTTLVIDRSRYAGVTSGEVEMKFGGGMISLDCTTMQFFEGLFRGTGGAVTSVDRKNDKIKIRIRQRDVLRFSGRGFPADWAVHLSSDMPWKVNLDAGAAEGDFDFTNLNFQQLNVNRAR